VIGYAKDKESVEVEEVWVCPNCKKKAVTKVYGRDHYENKPKIVLRKNYEGIGKYWH